MESRHVRGAAVEIEVAQRLDLRISAAGALGVI